LIFSINFHGNAARCKILGRPDFGVPDDCAGIFEFSDQIRESS
jgi:hypothetical protein